MKIKLIDMIGANQEIKSNYFGIRESEKIYDL